jgi:membrane fusion protein, heavy metal efflux system
MICTLIRTIDRRCLVVEGLLPILLLALMACSRGATQERSETGAPQVNPAAGDNGVATDEPGRSAAPQRGPAVEREAAAGGSAPSELSDLDRSLDDLLAAQCEHGVLQYTCDECRYEVGVVKVDPSLLRDGGPLDTLCVERRLQSRGLDLDGEVRLDEAKSVYLSPRAGGIIRAIHADLGSVVNARQILFEMDCPEFSDAKAEYLRARANLDLAQATLDRATGMFEQQICPQKDLLEARVAREQAAAAERAAREQLFSFGLTETDLAEASGGAASKTGWLAVRAPFAGRVLERNLGLGVSVEPGQQLLLLGDTSQMWVMTNLYERDLAKIVEGNQRDGLPADVQVAAYPGHLFKGRLDRLHGTLDPVTRTTKARVLVDNPDGLLRAGMFARVRLGLEREVELPAVPEAAVLDDEGRSFVFVRMAPPYFVRRPVSVRESADEWTQVLAGLAGGETVVTRGAFLLKSDVLRSKMGAGCAD